MAIPVFISQIVAASTDTVQAGAGSVQNIPRTNYYFLTSPVTSSVNGKSFLVQLKASADASSGTAWTFVFDANLKLKVTHNAGGTTNLLLNRGLAWNLGFAKVFSTRYPVDTSLTITIPVPAGAGGYTAEHRSPWLWCPEMWVSDTGPSLFDPARSPGIRTSAGSASRAPDMTASFTNNGEQFEATYIFTAVEYQWRARQPDLNANSPAHEREDYETWWQCGPKLGRRFLFWRDKSQLIGVTGVQPSGYPGSEAPAYVEYYPNAQTHAAPDISPTDPPGLVYWNIRVGCWGTKNGAQVYSDTGVLV